MYPQNFLMTLNQTFLKDLSFPGEDTSNFFKLNGIDHFNKFNLYTKHLH